MQTCSPHEIHPMGAIVIPAHNEQTVIARCLNAITADMKPGEFEIIVSCNGCNDQTAEIARQFAGVKVIESELGNKANALNLADEQTDVYPRIYVDADITLSTQALRKTCKALSATDEPRVAAPRLNIVLESTRYLVKCYYKIWELLPYCQRNMVGSGVYGLNQAGHEQIEQFPNLLAEDEYIRLNFNEDERIVIEDEVFNVYPPQSFRSLIKLRSRWNRGALEVAQKYPELVKREEREYGGLMRSILSKPNLWFALMIYCIVWLGGKLRTKWESRNSESFTEWTRDDSARTGQKKRHRKSTDKPEVVVTADSDDLARTNAKAG